MYNSRFDRGERGRQERPRGRRNDDRSFDSERNQENRRHPFVSDHWEDGEDSRDRAPRRFEDRGERRFGRDDRRGFFNREDRGERRFDRDDRRGSFNREDRGERRFDRDDRRGSFNREDRGERRFDRDDRRGSFNREDRGERRFGRDDRRGSFNREDRGERRFDRDDRRGSFNREDRGERRFGRDDRRGSFNREDRGERRFGRGDRRSSFGRDNRDYRPRRQEKGDQTRHAENIQKKEEGYIRLNRYIANAGICSRREADTMIEAGSVMVNGEVCTVLGTLVGPNDKVQFGGQTLKAEKKVYILMNKPKGYITTSDDPQERKTVMDLLQDACRERIYPVGRLDRNTTGVLLFTNDGDMAKNLTHPSHGARKIYHVTLDHPLAKSDLAAIAKGVDLEDGFTEVDEIAYVEENDRKEVGIQLHSGKNRIVRRIFEHFGYEVSKLDRVLFAELTKKDLSRGAWRFLTEQEINFLKMNSSGKAISKKKNAEAKAAFTEEQLAEAEALARADEAPVKKRATRKKAVEVSEEPVEEAPVKKRATRKKAVEVSEEPVEEAPVKKRATRKKTAEVSEEPVEEAPVKKRATRKKAAEVAEEPVEEAPVKKRATRKKAAEVAEEPVEEAPVKKRATRKKAAEVSEEPVEEAPVKKRATRKKAEK